MIGFKGKVYNVVRRIPRGSFLSYKEVAEKAAKSNAWRLVGNILNKNNPAESGIPCHRVIRSDGRIGGYNQGQKQKTALLRQEGIRIERGKVKKLKK